HLCECLRDVPGLRPFVNACAESAPAYYKIGLRYDADSFGVSRERFVAALRAEGIAFDEGFRALHAGRSSSRFRRTSDLEEADRAGHGAIVLHHPLLHGATADVEEVARAVDKVRAHRPVLLTGTDHPLV